MPTKDRLWRRWVEKTLLEDIETVETPDPVPVFETGGAELETSDAFDSYRYGRGDGQYLYVLYYIDGPTADSDAIVPVYIGESNGITSRLHQHFKKIRGSLPTTDWADDGTWGSWSKYDHMAAVYEQADSPLYAWILNIDELDACPYGFPTYRQELEAKLVGLVHSQPRFDRVFANREFVPNRVVHEMGKVGPRWLNEASSDYDPVSFTETIDFPSANSKAELWYAWVKATVLADINHSEEADPIPLFDTDDRGVVRLNHLDVLRRSDSIDGRIRREGKICVHPTGVRQAGPDGLLYVMYQLAEGVDSRGKIDATDIIPRYIGKAEAYGKKNELSANFEEIAKDRDATRSFARWGDGNYWHVGELSNTVDGTGSKKTAWAAELFEQGTRRLKRPLYLWVRAWESYRYPGPYGYPSYLAEVEPLLIGLAYDAYPDQLLNHEGVPDDAPVKRLDHSFTSVE